MHDAADARIEIENALSQPPADERPSGEATASRRGLPVASWLAIAVASALLGAWAAVVWLHPDAPGLDTVRRFTVQGPQLPAWTSVAISPDGHNVVFRAVEGQGMKLFLRPVDRFEAMPIPGTEGAHSPFFSPDSRWIAFFTGREIKKVSLAGGAAQTVCQAVGKPYQTNSATWSRDGTILFSAGQGESTAAPVVARVSENGGPVEVLTSLDLDRSERRHLAPELLPNGKTVLFTVEVPDGFNLAALSLESGEVSTVLEGVSTARFSPTGRLVFYDVETRQLLAAPFDPETVRLMGSPVPVIDDVGHTGAGLGAYDFSDDGTLVYVPASGSSGRRTVLVWVDRDGSIAPLLDEPDVWSQPRISPDGTRLLVRKVGVPNCDLWAYDFERSTLTRLTFRGDNHDPVWSPDGARVAFSSQIEATHRLYWMPADGSGEAQRLMPQAKALADNPQTPYSWSRNGRLLAFAEPSPETGQDVWVLELGGESEARPFLRTEFQEDLATFSPDGRWIAYQSDESGENEIYVRAFPGPGIKVQISTEGGMGPLWSNDGDELFYMSGSTMMRVGVVTDPEFRASTPHAMFDGDFDQHRPDNYDLSPDGRRFVMITWADEDDQQTGGLQLVLNWFEELTRTVPGP